MNGGRSLWLTVTLMLATAALVVSVPACQSPGPGDGERADRRPTRLVPADEVSVPPGVDPDQLTPLTGSALEHARLPLEQVLTELPVPDYLSRADEAERDADNAEADEPDVEVQRAYLNARQAWREGRNHDAINELDAALRLAPGQPHLLRLMARAYGAIGNRLRSAMHMRQALASDPAHVESLFILGRLALEQGDPGDAIVLFHRALDGRAASSGGRAVPASTLHYHLAAALLEAGHAAAAIDQHARYLEQIEHEGATTRQSADLAMADSQRGATWLAVGDAHHRLGDAGAALAAYEQAAEHGLADQPALVHRMVYTHLRLREAEPAQELAIKRVRASGGDTPSLDLVAYLTEQGVSAAALADELERLYTDEGESGAMAMAIAELLPRETAVELLRNHLTAYPADQRVFHRLLDDWLLPDGAADVEAEAIHQAVALTATVMSHAPNHGEAEDAAARLFDAAEGTSAVIEAFGSMPEAQREQPVVRVIEGMALGTSGRMNAAVAAFEQAMEDDPDLALARLQLVKVLVARQEYERAARLLEPMEESADSVPVLLRVRVLAETDQIDAALALLERMMDEQGEASVDLVLRKATLQVRAGDARAAERTLLDALNVRPEEERIYAALFELYSPENGAAEQIGDWQRQWTRLVRRLLGTIPESRLGRLVRAELLDAQGQRAEAEALLEQLLEEEPRDHEALHQLLDVYVRSNRQDEARELVESKIDVHPEDMALLHVARQFYQQIGDRDRMLEVFERMLSLEPAGATRARNLASLYLQTGRPERAVAVLDEALAEEDLDDPVLLVSVLWRAMLRADEPEAAQRRLAELVEQMPDHATELLYEQAMLAERLDDRQQSEALLLELLDRDPDHAMANNALGYAWTTQGRNLDRAKTMIQRAVDAEPDNAAYLDSLGWVYYKTGRFEEAVVWLRRARAAEGGDYPVIVDHLGDALYRADRSEDAERAWRDAQNMMDEQDYSIHEDPELKTLGDRLAEKLEAVEEDRDPAVAEAEEADQAVEDQP
ncbi:MAG: tetratricopeptide repeat protein [Phycisphaeraceae bacterium]